MKRKEYLLNFTLKPGDDLIEALETITAEIKAGKPDGLDYYFSLYSQAYEYDNLGRPIKALGMPKPKGEGYLSLPDNLKATQSEALCLTTLIKDITKK